MLGMLAIRDMSSSVSVSIPREIAAHSIFTILFQRLLPVVLNGRSLAKRRPDHLRQVRQPMLMGTQNGGSMQLARRKHTMALQTRTQRIRGTWPPRRQRLEWPYHQLLPRSFSHLV